MNKPACLLHFLSSVTCNLMPAHTHIKPPSSTLPPACVHHHKLSAAVNNKAIPKGVDIN